MIGRNDPCPCGSGKKYKKCCESKAAVTVADVKSYEVERILQTLYDEYPKRSDVPSYLEVADEWKGKLAGKIAEEMIEAIVLDVFFFQKRTDIWQSYIEKQLKKQVRPSILKILEGWREAPRMFIGNVLNVDDEYMTVRGIVDGNVIRLRREGEKPIPTGVHLFCFILPDETEPADQFLAVSTLIFFPVDHQSVFGEFAKLYEKADEQEFMQEHALQFWLMLSEDGYKGEEYSKFETGVLEAAVEFLKAHDRSSERLLETIENYLVELQPNARKEVAIAAGAIRYGLEAECFEPLDMTLKEIAEWFGVSPSSMNKYYKEITAYQEAGEKVSI